MEVEESDVAVEILDEGGAALHPVAAVQVLHAAHAPDFRAVDVAADHAVDALLAGELRHGVLEVRDVAHGGLGLELEVRGDRPVAEAAAPPHPVQVQVQVEDPVVHPRAHALEQPVEVHQAVELVPVQHEVAAPVGGGVDVALHQLHAAELHAGVVGQELVVVAVDVDDAGLLAVLAEDFLDQRVGRLVPLPVPAQLPAVNDVADEVEVARLVLAQEVEEQFGLGVFAAQVDVGNPDGAVVQATPGRRRLLRPDTRLWARVSGAASDKPERGRSLTRP
jgi:hypothetical protein